MSTTTPTERPTHNPNATRLKQLDFDTLGSMAVPSFTTAQHRYDHDCVVHVPVERAGVKP